MNRTRIDSSPVSSNLYSRITRFLALNKSSESTMAESTENSVLLEAFKSHWRQMQEIIYERPCSPTQELALTTFRHISKMVSLLIAENSKILEPTIGPILDYTFVENIFEKFIIWSTTLVEECKNIELQLFCLKNALKIYENLLNHRHNYLFVHKPILNPLLHLLNETNRLTQVYEKDAELRRRFIVLLNLIVIKITEENESPLLEFFYSEATTDFLEIKKKFPIFSYLITYLYDIGDNGTLVKDSCLLILSLSKRVQSIGRFIAEDTNFCPILATGLGALYSSLPKNIHLTSASWCRISSTDIALSKELQLFYSAIEFCNAVMQISHKLIVDQLSSFIFDGFLVPVMKPALLAMSDDEFCAAVYYLDLVVRLISDVQLMKIVVTFLLLERHNTISLLNVIVGKISCNGHISLICLTFIETLLDLHCEDLLLELALKYLIYGSHLQLQQNSDHDQNVYANSDPAPGLVWLRAASLAIQSPPVADPSCSFLAYCHDARRRIEISRKACQHWAFSYNQIRWNDKNLITFQRHRRIVSNCSDMSHNTVSDSSLKSLPENDCFLRNSDYRKSTTNRYYRGSSIVVEKNGDNSANRVSVKDLTLGMDTLISTGFESNVENLEIIEEPLTPRLNESETHDDNLPISMPSDYLTLSYALDDESENDTVNPNSKRLASKRSSLSDDFYTPRQNGFTLRGWSQLSDQVAFLELLDKRVKPSSSALNESCDALISYIETAYDLLKDNQTLSTNSVVGESIKFCETPPPTLNVDHFTLTSTSVGMADLIESKDSGFDDHSSPVRPVVALDDGVRDDVDSMNDFNSSPFVTRRLSYGECDPSAPDIGPFLLIILHKLENMLQNDVYTNLKLTKVISQLACYPSSILSSFLLDYNQGLHPTIRSLYQAISALRIKIGTSAIEVSNFDDLYQTAYRKFETDFYQHRTCTGKDKSKFGKFGEFFKLSSPMRRGSLKKPVESVLDILKPEAEQQGTSLAYCSVILTEFCKELAAISQEQYINYE